MVVAVTARFLFQVLCPAEFHALYPLPVHTNHAVGLVPETRSSYPY
jgi:hypothetical protein